MKEIEAVPTVIDAGASFDGLLTFRGSARVDGELTGRVVADGCLVIGPRGRVSATIECDELVVGGAFEGEATARERVELLSSSRVTGRLRAPRFALAEGCVFDGAWETLARGARQEPAALAEGVAEAASAP